MKFRTEVNLPIHPDYIRVDHQLMTIGSCFSDHVGNRLKELNFNVAVNPFGILFNPHTILKNLSAALKGDTNEQLLLTREGKVFHYDYHSSINGQHTDELKQRIIGLLNQTKDFLLTTDRLMITFGTAWVYRLIEKNELVANCHKIPQAKFKKELLDLDMLKEAYASFFEELYQLNPKLEILLTISPVRHVKNGLHENNVSKAVLHLLAHDLMQQHEKVKYFPAYELVIDDLRDYRFYNEDLVHPTNQSVKYVFEAFAESYFSPKTKELIHFQDKLNALKNHRTITGENDTDKQLKKIGELTDKIVRLRAKI
jgi:hypothetical protein